MLICCHPPCLFLETRADPDFLSPADSPHSTHSRDTSLSGTVTLTQGLALPASQRSLRRDSRLTASSTLPASPGFPLRPSQGEFARSENVQYLSRPIPLPRKTRSGGEDPFTDLAVVGRRATCPLNRKRQRLKPRGLAGDGVRSAHSPPPLSQRLYPELQLPEGSAAASEPPAEPRPLAWEAGSLSGCARLC